ncbi:MAG: hypothetical protein CVV42_01540 [Candidatus Riflebacteria bacterium HGW-Riflebacteria-2]|jgi:DNA helicase-2/ATP-dependent DNA helicase PcrA|nr:MAG: hypothetical protein CVV42_01540 [Candidatus Riflebacteria bacterium HGW-Riflebacteria-2]
MSLQDDLKKLNDQQSAIIKKFGKTSLVIAGPGTGKTRTISVLIGDLLHKNVRLKEILALTFSDKAALELRSRVLEYYPHSFDQCWISTFHSFCARILREQYHLVKVQPDFKLLTGFKEALLMSSICRRQQPEAFAEFGKVLNRRGFQQEVLTFISLLKSNLVEPEEFARTITDCSKLTARAQTRMRELLNLFKLYEKERNETGYLDFRDLISLTIRVMQNRQTAELYRKKFRVILVDEFQDTDPAQFLLLSLLKGDDDSVKTAVIGDPRQSIYRFRGADPGMMTASGPFKKKYQAKVFPLSLNYRSGSCIITAAANLKWREKSDADGLLKACHAESGFVKVYRVRDELEEARLIGRKIASLLIYGESRIYQPSDIAILVRNNYQIDLVAENLQALHIPFAIAGDMKFFRSEEVIALASLLKVASSTGSEQHEALQRAFASTVFAIKPLWVQAVFALLTPTFTIKDFFERLTGGQLEEIPEADEETLIKAASFAETVRILENCGAEPLNVVFARLLLVVSNLLKDPASETARNVLHFRGMISDYCEMFQAQHSRQPIVSDLMPEFDEWLTYYASTLEENSETKSDGIRIMTVHQSKGLEFPIVFVCGLCEGQFPVNLRENLLANTAALEAMRQTFNQGNRPVNFFNPYPVSHEDHLEEERRLFFVALTRAKEGAILTWPQRLGSDPALPAPFLKEIGIPTETVVAEERPLTPAEFRTRLSRLDAQALASLEPVLAELEPLIPPEISLHGIRPRDFTAAKVNGIQLPENFVFSASSLTNYIDCPRRFFFLNILKIRDPLQAKQPYFVIGNAFHECLEKLHTPGSIWEQGKLPDDGDLHQLYLENAKPMLDSLDFFQRHLEANELQNALPVYRHAIFQLEQMPPRNTIGVEHAFRFNLHGFTFVGRFDRLVRLDDSSAQIIDYKTTGSQAMNSEKIFTRSFVEAGLPQEIQMPLYLLACRELGWRNASAALLYIGQDAYKINSKGMQAGFLRSAALNYGCGPSYGHSVCDAELDRFSLQVKGVLDEIRQQRVFDCRPSPQPEARSCLHLNLNRQPKCEFYPFCQERLDQLRQQEAMREQL